MKPTTFKVYIWEGLPQGVPDSSLIIFVQLSTAGCADMLPRRPEKMLCKFI